MSDWVVRDLLAEDEPCVVSMWLKSYARTREVSERFPLAATEGHADQIRYWKTYQPIVVGILRASQVRVACDPARAEYEPGKPAVIWAWSCVSDDAVHWIGVKHNVIQSGVGRDIVGALLGDRLERPQRMTFLLRDLARLEGTPREWTHDRAWLKGLLAIAQHRLARDHVFNAAAAHILDTRREEWLPNTERAA